jgi:hypothetical protein
MGLLAKLQQMKKARRTHRVQQLVQDWETFMTGQRDTNPGSVSTGNSYPTFDESIKELSRKYEGIAEWGCDQTRTIIDCRAAFTIGDGIQVVEIDPTTGRATLEPTGKFDKERQFIQAFINHNNLDEEAVQEYAKEAELEGRILFRLIPNADGKNIDLRLLSYNTNHYVVESDPNDYQHYTKVTYKQKSTEITLNEGEFIYKKFAGRVDKVNDIMPKTATILRKLEDLDKAMKDLRAINNLFASPTPHFDCTEANAAVDLNELLKKVNWKIGKFIVTNNTKFTLVGADAAGAESIVKEVVSICKIISGIVGIPVHFLGLPDLMSNRSTSTDMFEMIIASTNRERKTWIGTYEEVFNLAMKISNQSFKTTFKEESVSCDIPQITAEKIKALAEVWLPLFQANVVDLDYMLSMVPNADPKRIKENADKEAQKVLDSMKMQEDANAQVNAGGRGTQSGGAGA